MWSDDLIKGKVLHKLTRMGKFEHSHTSIDNLPKGFPKHIRGRVKYCVADLIREGLLKEKPTSYGKEISVNVKRSKEVMAYVEVWLNAE